MFCIFFIGDVDLTTIFERAQDIEIKKLYGIVFCVAASFFYEIEWLTGVVHNLRWILLIPSETFLHASALLPCFRTLEI